MRLHQVFGGVPADLPPRRSAHSRLHGRQQKRDLRTPGPAQAGIIMKKKLYMKTMKKGENK